MNETSKSLAALRKNYTLGQLSEDDVPKDPIALFETWFAQASRAQCPEPNAMVLATANAAGTLNDITSESMTKSCVIF